MYKINIYPDEFNIGSILFFQYFALNMVSAASDLTLEFDWIDGHFNNSAQNSSAFNT